MGTVTHLPTRRPSRDRAFDLRLVPGTVVEHPDGDLWGPPCLAVLTERHPDGVHDWFVLSCGEEPAVVGTIASFPTIEGARVHRFDRDLLAAIRLADAFVHVMRGWTHPGKAAA